MDSSRLETIVTPDASPTAGDPVARARALVPLLAAWWMRWPRPTSSAC